MKSEKRRGNGVQHSKVSKNGMNGYNKSQYPYKTTKPRIVEGIDFLLESVKKKRKKEKLVLKSGCRI